jgi:hypothetical protein
MSARILLAAASLLVCFEAASAQPRTQTHGNVTFQVPDGWTTSELEGSLYLMPPRTGDGYSTIVIGPGIDLRGDFSSTFDAWLAERVAGETVLEQQASPTKLSDQGLEQRFAIAETESAAHGHFYHFYYAAHFRDRLEPIAVLATTETKFEGARIAFGGLVETLKYANAPQSSPPGTGAGERVLMGLYAGVSTRWTGGSASPNEYAFFFPNGVFFSGFPEGGFSTFDVLAMQRERPRSWGRYEVNGSQVLLHYQDGKGNLPATRDASGRLTVENRWILDPMPRVDGLRLSGTYAWMRNDPAFPSPPIRFSPDGRFEDGGAIDNVGLVGPGGFATVAPGPGEYGIMQHTLRLTYQNGQNIDVSIYVHPDDLASGRPRTIVLNKRYFGLVE